MTSFDHLPWVEKFRPTRLDDLSQSEFLGTSMDCACAYYSSVAVGRGTAAASLVLWTPWDWKDNYYSGDC